MANLEQKIIKPKRGVLELAKQLGSVSQACKTISKNVMMYIANNVYFQMV